MLAAPLPPPHRQRATRPGFEDASTHRSRTRHLQAATRPCPGLSVPPAGAEHLHRGETLQQKAPGATPTNKFGASFFHLLRRAKAAGALRPPPQRPCPTAANPYLGPRWGLHQSSKSQGSKPSPQREVAALCLPGFAGASGGDRLGGSLRLGIHATHRHVPCSAEGSAAFEHPHPTAAPGDVCFLQIDGVYDFRHLLSHL